MIAWGAIAGLHALVLGGLLIAKIAKPPPPAETTLMVNLISEAPAAPPEATPTPPEPKPPTPLPQMVTTPKPTMSAMTAPPVEETKKDVTPQPAPQVPAAPAASPGPTTTPPSFTAAYLNNPGPQYPVASRRLREEGTVRLKVLVNAGGTADQVLVERSSGFPNLDTAAADVVRKRWRFVPAKQGERAISAWVAIPMQFSLTNR
jgi:protein TonB